MLLCNLNNKKGEAHIISGFAFINIFKIKYLLCCLRFPIAAFCRFRAPFLYNLGSIDETRSKDREPIALPSSPFINKKIKIVSLAVRRFFAFAARRFGGGASPPLLRRQSRPSGERSEPFPSEAVPTFRRGAERAFSFGGCADLCR